MFTIYRLKSIKKVYVTILCCLILLTIYGYLVPGVLETVFLENSKIFVTENFELPGNDSLDYDNSVRQYFEKRESWTTSNLGSVLFKNTDHRNYSIKNKTFVILIWRHWDWLKRRHVGGYDDENPFGSCRVSNCIVTGDDKEIKTADAVVVHVQHGIIPEPGARNPSQRWVFLSDESPHNSFSLGVRPDLSTWANVFNWSMSYRSDADVPVPYGRTIPLPTSAASEMAESVTELIPFWKTKQKDVLASAMISHCSVTERMNYIKEMKKYIEVEVYGQCSERHKESCPGHFRADCAIINNYLFYLAFENTKCRQYLTEKIFYNAYAKGAIPIIMGAPLEDCDSLLPPHSFLHVDNFPSVRALVEEMKRIATDDSVFLLYHQWRRHFKLVNEHGFFNTKSYHICRLCEALNYNDNSPKVYDEDDLKLYFDPKLLCKPLYEA